MCDKQCDSRLWIESVFILLHLATEVLAAASVSLLLVTKCGIFAVEYWRKPVGRAAVIALDSQRDVEDLFGVTTWRFFSATDWAAIVPPVRLSFWFREPTSTVGHLTVRFRFRVYTEFAPPRELWTTGSFEEGAAVPSSPPPALLLHTPCALMLVYDMNNVYIVLRVRARVRAPRSGTTDGKSRSGLLTLACGERVSA